MTLKKSNTKTEEERKEEIRQKFIEYSKTKDKALRDELVEDHMYMVEILSNKYLGRGVDRDDLYQVASLGLIYAVERYDPSKGYEFSSFATPTILGELKRYFRDKGRVIKVPRRIQNLNKKINMAQKTLAQDLQKTPTVSDIADYLEVEEEEVLEAMEASQVYAPKSLDIQYEVGNGESPVDLLDIVGEDDQGFDYVELKDLIEKSGEKFNDLEKEIFRMRFFEERTQKYVSQKLEVSQMTVSRLEKKMIKKVKEELESSENLS